MKIRYNCKWRRPASIIVKRRMENDRLLRSTKRLYVSQTTEEQAAKGKHSKRRWRRRKRRGRPVGRGGAKGPLSILFEALARDGWTPAATSIGRQHAGGSHQLTSRHDKRKMVWGGAALQAGIALVGPMGHLASFGGGRRRLACSWGRDRCMEPSNLH